MATLRHRAAVGGLRARAVLPVVFYHVHFGFPGGFVGVDVLFVISGDLITGIILSELGQDKFTIIGFYERRVRRILPAFEFMVIGVLTAGWYPESRNDPRRSQYVEGGGLTEHQCDTTARSHWNGSLEPEHDR